MRVIIAGAGSGKTSSMANIINDATKSRATGKYFFCIAFTNNAVGHISDKLRELNRGKIPQYIKVTTIHSFLYQEIIKPYYFLLYGINYDRVSLKPLSDNPKYRQKEVAELDKKGVLHVTAMTQRARWILKGKSTDKKVHKEKRKKILDIFSAYCGYIFVDETQDIDGYTREILETLDLCGVQITVVGDPKQDLHGYGNLRVLLENENYQVEYISKCYRCPEKHLKISNSIVDSKEVQTSEIDGGSVRVIFETEISDIGKFIESEGFDLSYIVKKNERFDTHSIRREGLFNELFHLIFELVSKYFEFTDLMMHRYSYWATKQIVENIEKGTELSKIVEKVFDGYIERCEYAQIATILDNRIRKEATNILVSSIENIKGQEGDNCLFILSRDLAAYLFLDKNENNKTKAALYVALTRSRKDLTILVTKEAAEKYSESFVIDYFNQLYEKN